MRAGGQNNPCQQPHQTVEQGVERDGSDLAQRFIEERSLAMSG